MRLRLALLLCLLVSIATSAAHAVPTFANLMTIEQEGVGTFVIDSDMALCDPTSSITFACNGTGLAATPAGFDFTLSDWNLALSQNPSVNSAFGFTNNSASTQTFTITVEIPVAITGPSSLIGGSMGGSTTDNGDGLGGLGTAAGSPIYQGLIDGAGVLAIYPDPTSFNYIFGGQTVTIPAMNPGLPGPTIGGPAVTATIGIRNRFTLSAGDTVAMTNFFQAEPVPEPSTALLLGLGLAAAGMRRRT